MVQLSSPTLDISPPPECSEEWKKSQGSPKSGSPKMGSPGGLSALQLALTASTTTYLGYENYIEDGLICLKHKIRNMEKKKVRRSEGLFIKAFWRYPRLGSHPVRWITSLSTAKTGRLHEETERRRDSEQRSVGKNCLVNGAVQTITNIHRYTHIIMVDVGECFLFAWFVCICVS